MARLEIVTDTASTKAILTINKQNNQNYR